MKLKSLLTMTAALYLMITSEVQISQIQHPIHQVKGNKQQIHKMMKSTGSNYTSTSPLISEIMVICIIRLKKPL